MFYGKTFLVEEKTNRLMINLNTNFEVNGIVTLTNYKALKALGFHIDLNNLLANLSQENRTKIKLGIENSWLMIDCRVVVGKGMLFGIFVTEKGKKLLSKRLTVGNFEHKPFAALASLVK